MLLSYNQDVMQNESENESELKKNKNLVLSVIVCPICIAIFKFKSYQFLFFYRDIVRKLNVLKNNKTLLFAISQYDEFRLSLLDHITFFFAFPFSSMTFENSRVMLLLSKFKTERFREKKIRAIFGRY